MRAGGFLLAIDQGTTSTRSILFRPDMSAVASAQEEFPQHYPAAGHVEHDPEDLWRTALGTARAALAKAGIGAGEVAGIGIANQRETAIVWERATGRPIHPAIVWQDRRTADLCETLRRDGHEALVAERTGLLVDPYFSATKIAFILDAVEGARPAAERGELAFGTVDTWLLWKLTGGTVHASDATNAARTMLFDIGRGEWDDDLLRLLRVPRSLLPAVRDCAGEFGRTDPALFGAPIAIRALVGDQQAATVGQACFAPGMAKSTFGTGSFVLLNTGEHRVQSRSRLLSTIAYQLGGRRTYALEGSIFVAGAAVQWLRDGLGLIGTAAETGPMAAEADSGQDVILVPAFVGLGAPHWAPHSRGALFGLTRNTGPRELARAALESVCFQTADLLDAMRADWPEADRHRAVLRVDGGMVASDWTMQRLADLLDAPVDRPAQPETTALGAAYLAGLSAGLCPDPEAFAPAWRLDRRFEPAMAEPVRTARLAGWRDAVSRVIR